MGQGFERVALLARRAAKSARRARRAMVTGHRITVEAVRGAAEATRHVRHQVYCLEKGFLTPDNLFDYYDHRATLLNAFDGEEPIGTMRLTDSAEGCLELFEMHPELAALVPAGRRYIEFSRLMVVRRYRDMRATMPIFRRAIAEVMTRRVDGVVMSCAKHLIPYYSRLAGFRLLSTQPLTHGRLSGLVDYPMILELPEALTQLTLARAPFWFAISPSCFARAVGMTAVRKVRELLPAGRPSWDGLEPAALFRSDAQPGLSIPTSLFGIRR